MSQTPFIFIRGVYQNDQAGSYAECLRLLRGKTNRACAYVRPTNLTNPASTIANLATVAKDNGITLMPGIDVAWFTNPRLDWHSLWQPVIWRAMATEAIEFCASCGVRDIALVMEEAFKPFYDDTRREKLVPPWKAIQECVGEIHKAGLVPWFDMPVIWWSIPAEPILFANTCTRLIKTFQKACPTTRWLCGYEFGGTVSKYAQRTLHSRLVGSGQFHRRIFSCVNKEHSFESDVNETKNIIDSNDGNQIIVYAKFDDVEDGTQLAEAL